MCVHTCVCIACAGTCVRARQGLEKSVLFYQPKLSSIGPTLSKLTATLSLFPEANCASHRPCLFFGHFALQVPGPVWKPLGLARGEAFACLRGLPVSGRLPLRSFALRLQVRVISRMESEPEVRWPPRWQERPWWAWAGVSSPVTSRSGSGLAPELHSGSEVTQQPFLSTCHRVPSSAGRTSFNPHRGSNSSALGALSNWPGSGGQGGQGTCSGSHGWRTG